MNMKKLNTKISKIFSIRAIVSLICMSLMTSCVTSTYPINTRQHASYHSQTNTVSDPTVPLLLGAAALGTIAYYGKKKYDDYQKPRIKHKPIRTKPIPPRPIKKQYTAHRANTYNPEHNINRHAVKSKSAKPKPHYRPNSSNNNRRATSIRQNRNVNNQRNSTRNPQNTRRQTIERTREQLQQRRSGDQNVTVNTASASSETNRNRNRKASRKNQQ